MRITDPHRGRPADPEHAERGAQLMAQWEAEDRIAEIDRLAEYLAASGAA